MLTLSMKQNTSRPFTAGPCIGCLGIGLKELLAKCMNDQGAYPSVRLVRYLYALADAILELKAGDERLMDHTKGIICVTLSATDFASSKGEFGVHILVPGDNPVIEYVMLLSYDKLCYISIVHIVLWLFMVITKICGQQQMVLTGSVICYLPRFPMHGF
jgi:hypothetical protein